MLITHFWILVFKRWWCFLHFSNGIRPFPPHFQMKIRICSQHLNSHIKSHCLSTLYTHILLALFHLPMLWIGLLATALYPAGFQAKRAFVLLVKEIQIIAHKWACFRTNHHLMQCFPLHHGLWELAHGHYLHAYNQTDDMLRLLFLALAETQ